MSSKKKGGVTDFGDFMVPIIDLLSILIMKSIELLGFLLTKVIKRALKKKEDGKIVKIERDNLKSRKIVFKDDELGYSVTKKRPIKMNELSRKKHSMIIGASGFGKSVLIDSLIYDDLRGRDHE